MRRQKLCFIWVSVACFAVLLEALCAPGALSAHQAALTSVGMRVTEPAHALPVAAGERILTCGQATLTENFRGAQGH